MQNRFDQLAYNWDSNPVRVEVAEKVISQLSKYLELNNKMRVLDYGTGTGLILIGIQPFVKEITGMDNSAGMLHILKEKIVQSKLSNVITKQHNIDTDALRDNYFDLIITNLTLHHIQNYQTFIEKSYKANKKGGFLVIVDLITEDGSFHGDGTEGIYHNGFDIKELEATLLNYGYFVVEISQFHHITKDTPKGKRDYPLFFAIAEKK